jgi:hypothetical protein
MTGLSWSERVRAVWFRVRGRCPECQMRHAHKLGCSRRPGRGMSLPVRRRALPGGVQGRAATLLPEHQFDNGRTDS